MEGLPLIPALGELGFTEYEAKVYLALLEESPLSGYDIARASGVPRSKVYEVLRGMVGRGEVLVSHGEPVPLRAAADAGVDPGEASQGRGGDIGRRRGWSGTRRRPTPPG